MRPIDAVETRKKMLNLLDELFENIELTGKMLYQYTLIKTIIHAIDEAQTIDAEPVINAQWELVRYDPDYLQWSAKCTNCNNRHESNENVGRLPFCPHCGAAMQGERVPKLISAEEE